MSNPSLLKDDVLIKYRRENDIHVYEAFKAEGVVAKVSGVSPVLWKASGQIDIAAMMLGMLNTHFGIDKPAGVG